MYKNGFVVSVKNSSKDVLREDNGKVWLPFYEEYELLLKNTNCGKAAAKVFIDGEDVTNGRKLIIKGYDSFNLKRFISDNMEEGRKFQFVPQSDGRITEKKNSPDLGIIEVVFQREKKQNLSITWEQPIDYLYRQPYVFPKYSTTTMNYNTQCNVKAASLCSTALNVSSVNDSCCNLGGTARGSRSRQRFGQGNINELEDKTTTIRLRILPTESQRNTVSSTKKCYCVHCGEKNINRAKFCFNCGNKIEQS